MNKFKMPDSHIIGCKILTSESGIIYVDKEIFDFCKENQIGIKYKSYRWNFKNRNKLYILDSFTDFNIWKYDRSFESYEKYLSSGRFNAVKKSILESKNETGSVEEIYYPHYIDDADPYYYSKDSSKLTYLRMSF